MDINKYNMFCHCERSEAIAKSLGLLRFARNDILDLIMTIYLPICIYKTKPNFQISIPHPPTMRIAINTCRLRGKGEKGKKKPLTLTL
jgi:hypothetical protein